MRKKKLVTHYSYLSTEIFFSIPCSVLKTVELHLNLKSFFYHPDNKKDRKNISEIYSTDLRVQDHAR